MNAFKATVFLGALLSTGMLMAQQPDATQAPTPPQAAPAQRGMRHGRNPNKQAKHIAKELGLNGGQEAQIKPILADRRQQMEALRADTSLAPQDRRAKARAIMQDSNAKIEALLSDTQKQKYEQMLAERREHRGHRGSPSPQG